MFMSQIVLMLTSAHSLPALLVSFQRNPHAALDCPIMLGYGTPYKVFRNNMYFRLFVTSVSDDHELQARFEEAADENLELWG